MTSPRRGFTYADNSVSTREDDRAAVTPCQRVDPEVFFPETTRDTARAKRTCRRCDIQDACLAGALERREPWGVWGGELFVAGEVMQPKARPVKDAA